MQERHMAEITLKVESGRPLGTRPTGRLRTGGKIPGVVYGHGMAPIPVAVGARDLRAALTTEAGLNALLSLKIGDTTHLAIAKELQRHPVRQNVTHVDFQVVRRDEIVTAEVRIALVGDSEAVRHAEGTIDQEMLSLQIKAKPGDVPAVIEVDISSLDVGESLRVSDIQLPEGVTSDVDPETAVAVAHMPRALEPEPEAEAEAAEGAAGGEQPAGPGEG
jgi:large subunit ribosomal protein L25